MIDQNQLNQWLESGELSHVEIMHAQRLIDATGALWQFTPPADFIALAKQAPPPPDDFHSQAARAWRARRDQVEAGNREHDRQLASEPLPDEEELRRQAKRLGVSYDNYAAAAQRRKEEASQRVADGQEAERQAQQKQMEEEQRQAWEEVKQSGDLYSIMRVAGDVSNPHHEEARAEARKQIPSYEWPE